MKALKDILKILAFVLTLGVIALFFFDFAAVGITGVSQAVGLKGIDLAFGGNISFSNGGETVTAVLAKSGYYLFIFILSVFSAALAAFGFKKTGSSVAGMIFSVITGIVFAVIGKGNEKYIDVKRLDEIGDITGTGTIKWLWIAVALCFAAAVISAAALLVQDYLKVKVSGGKTIPKRVLRFFRDYKVEIKKITWPKFGTSVKNTGIVIIISVIIGIFVWLLDLGLSELINFGLGIEA